MSPKRIPFKKTATIYKSDKFISIEALSGGSALKYREDKGYRVYLEPETPDEALGQVLLSVLEKSRQVDPRLEREFFDPERATRVYTNWEKDFMSRYSYKTRRDAYSNLDWCYTKMSDGDISIQPHRRNKTGSWKSLPAEQTVVVPTTTDAAAVGAALRLALSRCE